MAYENFIEFFGIFASFVILISLLMRSVKRLRLINLMGSVFMFTYGYMIDALPVMIMNVGIFSINMYYLRQMFQTKDYFDVIRVEKDDAYLKSFLDFHRSHIKTAMSQEAFEQSDYRFFILRNMVPAGLFIVRKQDEKTLEIILDFVTPRYKDFKTGKYVFSEMAETFRNEGFENFITDTKNENHMRYLEKMAFNPVEKENDRVTYTKDV